MAFELSQSYIAIVLADIQGQAGHIQHRLSEYPIHQQLNYNCVQYKDQQGHRVLPLCLSEIVQEFRLVYVAAHKLISPHENIRQFD